MKRSQCWVKHDASGGRWRKNAGDCQVQALATARGLSYETAWQQLYALQGETHTCGFDLPQGLKTHPRQFGVVRALAFPAVRRQPRMTAETFCRQHPAGRFVLRMANHVAAVKDGQLFDAWNSSSRCVYGAWEVEAADVVEAVA